MMQSTVRRKLFRLKQRADRYFLKRSVLVSHRLQHRKLGSDYGGWFIPADLFDASSLCYCFGAGEDISFDMELIGRFGCQVFTFDPTPRALAYVRNLMANETDAEDLHFYDFGVWREDSMMKFFAPRDEAHVSHSILNLQNTADGFEAQCYTLQTIMGKLEHRSVDLVKLDIEGAEYAVLGHMIETGIRPSVICVEFDEGPNPKDGAYIDRIGASISRLGDYGYVVTHMDFWNFTFVNKKLVVENAD